MFTRTQIALLFDAERNRAPFPGKAEDRQWAVREGLLFWHGQRPSWNRPAGVPKGSGWRLTRKGRQAYAKATIQLSDKADT